jgi:hypothetical protein
MELGHYRVTDAALKQFLRVNYQVKIHCTVMEVHQYQKQDYVAKKIPDIGRASQFL